MTVKTNKKYIEIVADEGKLLKLGNKAFKGGSFPLDFDYSEIEEIENPVEQEVETDE